MKNFALSVQTTFRYRKIICRRTIFTSLIVINYLNWEDLRRAIGYDITQEKEFSYKGISTDTMVEHITRFVSGLWQIHAFCEGNTRTTAVFTILYLRSIGFKIDNSLFARHSWYFRNALVRANYKNAIKGIDYTSVYLERFFRNLLLGEKWDLRNRYLHIHATDEWKVHPNLDIPTSTPQVPTEHPTSTLQVKDKLHTSNPYILELIKVIGNIGVGEVLFLHFLVNYKIKNIR